MTGIIDIGTNTVRLVIYDDNKIVSNTAVRSEIMKDTSCGKLTDEGVLNLLNSVKTLISGLEDVKIYAIATEAVRVLENKEDIIKKIEKETGILIDILSGEEEAECIYLGMMAEIPEKNGIITDLGGGSLEIIEIEGEKVKKLNSYPAGCKRITRDILNENMTIEEKTDKIADFLTNIIENSDIKGNIYMTGGSARTLQTITNALKGKEVEAVELSDMEIALFFLSQKSEEDLKKMFSERYDTIETGIVIIKTLTKLFKKERIYVKTSGIREGYLKKLSII